MRPFNIINMMTVGLIHLEKEQFTNTLVNIGFVTFDLQVRSCRSECPEFRPEKRK